MKAALWPVLLSSLIFACDNMKHTNPDQVISQDDTISTRHYTANVGDTVTIKIISNPTTGYDWISDLDSNYSNVKLVSESFESMSNHNEMLVGAPSVKVLKYVMLQKGEHKAGITYYRAWEPKMPDNEHKDFIFHVK